MAENQNNQAPVAEELDLNEILKVRRAKLESLQAAGKNPFEKVRYDRDAYSADIKADYDNYENKVVGIAGRLISKRVMGKASFAVILDKSVISTPSKKILTLPESIVRSCVVLSVQVVYISTPLKSTTSPTVYSFCTVVPSTINPVISYAPHDELSVVNPNVASIHATTSKNLRVFFITFLLLKKILFIYTNELLRLIIFP